MTKKFERICVASSLFELQEHKNILVNLGLYVAEWIYKVGINGDPLLFPLYCIPRPTYVIYQADVYADNKVMKYNGSTENEFKKRYSTRVSIRGVKSLGGHFACLCQGFDFYEVKK